MNLTTMKSVPKTREEFERNLNLLAESIRKRKYHIFNGMSTDSLSRVRSLPNNRINFMTVDESVRLQANTIADCQDKGLFDEIEENLVD